MIIDLRKHRRNATDNAFLVAGINADSFTKQTAV